jgi:hypothetical protein
MRITNKRTGAGVHWFELQALEQERRDMLDLQMPSFIRGDEDEVAEDLFYLQPQPTTPA